MSGELIDSLIGLIIEGDLDLISQIVDDLPLMRMDIEKSDRLLSILLDTCSRYEKSEIAKKLYETWAETHPEEGHFSLFSYMLGKQVFTTSSMLFLFYTLDRGLLRTFGELLTRDDSPTTLTAVTRLIDISHAGDRLDLVMDLMNMLEEDQESHPDRMYNVKKYVNSVYTRIAPYTEKPLYMISPSELPDADLLEDVSIELQSIDSTEDPKELSELMISSIIETGIDVDPDVQKELISKLSIMPIEERVELSKTVIKTNEYSVLQDDVELFKIFGPSHPVHGIDLNNNTPCGTYGGCRMFLCVCFESSGDEPDIDLDLIDQPDLIDPFIIDWYTGVCDFCHMKISKRCYALRRPLETGGWKGCYCSSKCLRDDLPSGNIMISALIDSFMDKIEQIGIYDRMYKDIS